MKKIRPMLGSETLSILAPISLCFSKYCKFIALVLVLNRKSVYILCSNTKCLEDTVDSA